MAVFDKIRKGDYNRVQTKVANILGTGSGSFGYGQFYFSSPVTESNRVTVTQWENLQYDLINISRYQNGTIPSLPVPEDNSKIRFNSTTEPVSRFETFVAGVETNRFNIPATSYTEKIRAQKNFTGGWNKSLVFFIDVIFPTVDFARHYFNLGGKIKFTASRSGGTTSGGATTIRAQNESWSLLLDDVDAQFGGAPTTLSDSLNGSNFYRCKEDYVNEFYVLKDDGVYAKNEFRVAACTPGIPDNRPGVASVLQFRVTLQDDHTQINQFAVADGVDGTVGITVSTNYPTGRNYPNNTLYTNYNEFWGPSNILIGDGIPQTVANF